MSKIELKCPVRRYPVIRPEPRISDWDEFKDATLYYQVDATDTLIQGATGILVDLAKEGLKALDIAGTGALIALIFA